MEQPLVFLRIIGLVFGVVSIWWSFTRFRARVFRRRQFFLVLFFGVSLAAVSLFPGSVNFITELLLMETQHYGRLITLLIISNLALWMLTLESKHGDLRKSIEFDLLLRHLCRERFVANHGRDCIREIAVLIPSYNEARNLEELLPRIPKAVGGLGVSALVINDGSTDDTDDVVKRNGCHLVESPIRRGQGAALRLGYDLALTGGAKIVVTMDGDGQHHPEDIEGLIAPIEDGSADIVIGSRLMGEYQWESGFRFIGLHLFNHIISFLTGTRITDCASGFRAFRVNALKRLTLIQNQFQSSELIIDAAKKGCRITEAPIRVTPRFHGESKKGRNIVYGFHFSTSIFKTWLRN